MSEKELYVVEATPWKINYITITFRAYKDGSSGFDELNLSCCDLYE